jgi:hypothetical protein
MRINISFNIMTAKSRRISADPLVITIKNFLFGERPIIAKIVLNENIQRKIPDKNIMTIINLENKSGRLKSLNRIIVPAEVHHKYDHGDVTTIERPVKYLFKNLENVIVVAKVSCVSSLVRDKKSSLVDLSNVDKPK